MNLIQNEQPIPVHSLSDDPILAGELFSMIRMEGTLSYQSELLVPHRKAYYLMVFAKTGTGRHWVDMRPYTIRESAFYFSGPNQLIVKEEAKPIWGTAFAFTAEFLALQDNASLGRLPLIRNPHNAHELLLNEADAAFTEDLLDKIYKEYNDPGEWQQRMLTAYLTVLLTYLSRLYTEQFEQDATGTDKLVLKKYHAKIDEHFREMHQVSEYASLLNVSAGHLSEIVKVQSGRPAIAHIHERLVMEARRMLFHTEYSLKEIAYDLGFSDASYFNRFFKRETDLTPAEYRASIREMYH
ncbi:helix-turn-helix domain-containing protein [Dyadobacter luticola]|uniref:Helix-turn-helix domain-containing protein n=1 Tax=Dyadobacter luticola TaxID=1979387 RepID=A0A5R9L2Y8_9BACT|nr:helix-turn-helix domain-containing protein [Dyadobacter luticola]TLV02903.1 helix-turn-helix domain-containing protein [Dyadobacter luticola]